MSRGGVRGDGTGRGQFSQPINVVAERGAQMFEDYRQLREVVRIHGLYAQSAYAIFKTAGSGKSGYKTSKQSPNRWLLMIHSVDFRHGEMLKFGLRSRRKQSGGILDGA